VRLAIDFLIDQDTLERAVEVPVIARQVLVVPLEFARGDIERQGRVGVEHRTVT
jgi:hypothetical protein